MITHLCDRCGAAILRGDVRYIARIEVFAAPDVLEIGVEDLLTDQSAELDKWLAACERMSEEELMRDVHVRQEFDLCRACQLEFVTRPFGR